jgi:hypothetical protein
MTLNEFFTATQAALPARRGNLYQQYFERKGVNGKTRRYGPYYVWTRCEGGKMVSHRVAQEDVSRVQQEIARGKTLGRLIDELWKLAEKLARDAGDTKKKTSTNSKGRRPHLSPKP